MRPTFAVTLLVALACALALGACRGGGTARGGGDAAAHPEEVLAEVNSFTAELMRKVETARDPSAGLEEAQQLLDARRDALAARISALKRSPSLRADDEARGRLLESEVENVRNVSTLRTKYMSEAMRDGQLRERIDRFVNSYASLWRE
ncbi:MAG TPA: hypothetical protein VEY09_08370 [Pyrinomonadaceae bacterium]|nr:hypothetical protein [Pyrinomonadaceae bacterium]